MLELLGLVFVFSLMYWISSLMKKKFKLAFVIFIAILIMTVILLNPNQGSFNHWFMEGGKQTINNQIVVNEITEAVKSHLYNKKLVIERQDYIVMSTFTIPSATNGSYEFVGFLWYFIRIR